MGGRLPGARAEGKENIGRAAGVRGKARRGLVKGGEAGHGWGRAERGRSRPMSSMETHFSYPSLRAWLEAAGGAVPFRRFMEAALYDPGFGYYGRRIGTVGARGDFATSASLSGRLARAVAAWMAEEGQAGGCREVIEIGPGSGQLHQALRQALGWRGRWHWRSHLVERSAVLAAEQRAALGQGRAQWHTDPAAALAAAGGKALIFSNELVDAFPATLLQRQDGVWQEVWLELRPSGSLVEALRPAGDCGTSLVAADFAEGQRVECHAGYRDWLEAWRPQWRAGTMLTIDYGALGPQLYRRRPGGSLRGYRRHQRLEGLALYGDPGSADLTADVNFSDLLRWGKAAGLANVALESQADFLARYSAGRGEIDARLADPGEAGGAFLCLQQRPV